MPGRVTVFDLHDYLRLFAPYEAQLQEFTAGERPYGGRFAFLFRQVVNQLVLPSRINSQIPRLFIEVAQRYLHRDAETVRHFSYEDNRHFFLSDLLDWLQLQRGRSGPD